jgi:hypothetical protein
MAIVQFNSVQELLAELTADLAQLDRRLVRVTNLYQQSPQTPIIQCVSVVATARVAADILRLDVFCGDVWSADTPHNTPVWKKVEAIQHHLRASCEQLGIEVRAGLWNIADAE